MALVSSIRTYQKVGAINLLALFPLKVMRHLPRSCEDLEGGRIAEGLVSHSLRVGAKSTGFVEYLHALVRKDKLPKDFPFSKEEVMGLCLLEAQLGGTLHDVGKIILGQNRKNRMHLLGATILYDGATKTRKPQLQFLDKHVSLEMIGATFREVFFTDYQTLPDNVLSMICHHHRDYKGNGFGEAPARLADQYNTLAAQTARLADGVDVKMSIDRLYSPPKSFNTVVSELEAEDSRGGWPKGLVPVWVAYMKKNRQLFPEVRPSVLSLPVLRERLYGTCPDPV